MLYKNKKNIFRNCKKEDIRVSAHFLKRWNERVGRIKFEHREDLEMYIRRNFEKKDIYHLEGDHYIMDKILGGIYLTAVKEKDKITLITTLGSYNENPVMYNIITSGEMNKVIEKYGKINLSYAV